MLKMSKRFSIWPWSVKTGKTPKSPPGRNQRVEIITSLLATVLMCAATLGYSSSLLLEGVILAQGWVMWVSGGVVGFMAYRLVWLALEAAKLDAHYWVLNEIVLSMGQQDLGILMVKLVDRGDLKGLKRLRWACAQLGYLGLVTMLDNKLNTLEPMELAK